MPESNDLLSRGALRHELAKRLLIEIFSGRLPEGTRLVAMNLASRFGVSCTPVREALFELEANEVIEVVHNRGAIVKRFGPEELRGIFLIRRIIETEATRLACPRVDKSVLESLRQRLKELSKTRRTAQWFELELTTDRELHTMIAEQCGVARLATEFQRYNTLVEALRSVVGNERVALREAVESHIEIVDAMIANNAEAAAKAMTRHIEQAARSAEAAVFGEGKRQR